MTDIWGALERYQPYADRHGFGDAWRRMCEARTQEAAHWAAEAAREAGEAMDDAAWAADAVELSTEGWEEYAFERVNFAIVHEERDPILRCKVYELELADRTIACLLNWNIECIGDLMRHTEAGLLSVPNIRKKEMTEIQEALKGLGLKLRSAEPL
jgi:DNA-directed RNA polymerase alpha subunit